MRSHRWIQNWSKFMNIEPMILEYYLARALGFEVFGKSKIDREIREFSVFSFSENSEFGMYV